MELRDHIDQIRGGLTTGSFPNEASVSQGIVLRLLQSLHWPIFDSTVVCPEYSVGGRRVDFALCHPPGKALVFIEVKNIGKDEGADRQLFEYAFHVGVPLAVLTDGRQWSFYLPGEQGSYDERRVYRLDLVDRDLDECEKRLQRYLNFSDCCSGKAVEAAKEDYRDQTKKRQIHQTLPQAWARLIKEPDELLVELLTNEVESLCGYKPDLDLVASFVRGQEATRTPSAETYALHGPPSSTFAIPVATPNQNQHGPALVLKGRQFQARNAREVLIKFFEEICSMDPGFPQRFAAIKHGHKRRYLAQRKEDLYPNRPDLLEGNSHRLQSGWWLGLHYSKSSILRIMRMACDVAGLTFDRDVKVNLG